MFLEVFFSEVLRAPAWLYSSTFTGVLFHYEWLGRPKPKADLSLAILAVPGEIKAV